MINEVASHIELRLLTQNYNEFKRNPMYKRSYKQQQLGNSIGDLIPVLQSSERASESSPLITSCLCRSSSTSALYIKVFVVMRAVCSIAANCTNHGERFFFLLLMTGKRAGAVGFICHLLARTYRFIRPCIMRRSYAGHSASQNRPSQICGSTIISLAQIVASYGILFLLFFPLYSFLSSAYYFFAIHIVTRASSWLIVARGPVEF